ncbi:MAG: zinc ribbon domain-containing protein [Lachnospiraceae bacterium]|nr:zinc ribbon domain-containing protein [Lachnospiraceae bacterium]
MKVKCCNCMSEYESELGMCPYCGFELEIQGTEAAKEVKIYCSKCGKKIIDTAKFCPYCGTRIKPYAEKLESQNEKSILFESLEIPDEEEDDQNTDWGAQNRNKKQKKHKKERKLWSTIARLAILAGLVFFFCPFMMVSCGGESIECSGIELMIGQDASGEKFFDDDQMPNLFLVVSFGAGIVGLLFSLCKSKIYRIEGVGGMSGIAIAGLVLFRSRFWKYYGLEYYKGSLDFEFRWGWTLAVVLFGIALLSAILQYSMEDS